MSADDGLKAGSSGFNTRSGVMYVHTFVFQCPQCTRPIALASLELEHKYGFFEGQSWKLICPCSWSGEMPGFEARYHWVGLGWHEDASVSPGKRDFR